MYPAQIATVLIKDLIVMDAFSLKHSTKRPEVVVVDLTSRTNRLLDDGTYGLSVQFGNLHFEEEEVPLIGRAAPLPTH